MAGAERRAGRDVYVYTRRCCAYRDQMVVFYSRQRNRSGGVGLRECCVYEGHFEITCSVGVLPC